MVKYTKCLKNGESFWVRNSDLLIKSHKLAFTILMLLAFILCPRCIYFSAGKLNNCCLSGVVSMDDRNIRTELVG